MRVSVFPIAYLPPVSYFAQLAKAGEIMIDIYEHYIKQSLRNRTAIYGANGKLFLSIPVVKRENPKTPVRDIRISYHLPWQKIHRRAIESAYNSSPFMLYYFDAMLPYYEKKYSFLHDYNNELMNTLMISCRISKEIAYSDTYVEAGDKITDLRNPLAYSEYECKPYQQVFSDKLGFIPDLSIIDLLFNLGPDTEAYLTAQ